MARYVKPRQSLKWPTTIAAVACALLSLSDVAQARAAERCLMTAQERAWVDNALAASKHMMEQRLRLPPYPHPTIIVFSDDCRFELKEGGSRWFGESHSGKIRVGKANLDAGLVAYQDQDFVTGERFMAMALPPLWVAAKVATPADPGLTAVFLHEYSHARQSPVVRSLFERAEQQFKPLEPPDNDDSLQAHFENDPAYVAVWEKENSLLYQAAGEPDASKARELARQALELMEARQKRWFVGPEAMWKTYDDLYLSMEGLGQWVAYAWLSDPKGAGMPTEAALAKIRGRKRQWSQEEGLGLFLVIDRFVPDWPQRAFAPEPALAIDLLRLAVGRQTPS